MTNHGLTLRLNPKNENSMVKSFISNFLQEDFFKDLISISLYPADFNNTSSVEGNSISTYIKQFLKSLDKISRTIKLSNIQDMKKNIQLIDTVLTIRDSNLTSISYNNVFTHLNDLDLSQQKLITDSKNIVNDSAGFKSLTDKILQSIDTYYSVQEIFDDIINYENVVESMKQGDCPIYEGVENWINNVLNLYNKVTNSNSFKKDKDTDYYVLSDEESVNDLSKDITDYIFNGYSIYKTGLDVVDFNLKGFESGSVHVFSAPSNNGKSLLLSYLTMGIIENNINDWEENDAILILTLEDDAKKLTRRLLSMYGNIDQDIIRNLYYQGYDVSKQLKEQDSVKSLAQNKFKVLFNKILSKSILNVTKKKVKLVIKHCSENVFSATSLTKFLDRLKLDGINVKICILDYIDVMTTSFKNHADNTYMMQGQITQELRLVSRNYKIPIITATQSNKSVADEHVEQNIGAIGDSWKKVTYADFVYMVRMYYKEKDLFNDLDVRRDILTKNQYVDGDIDSGQLIPEISMIAECLRNELILFEFKISKSKEGNKDKKKYLLVSKRNLRFYNNLEEYMNDRDLLNKNSAVIESELQKLIGIINIGEDLPDINEDLIDIADD